MKSALTTSVAHQSPLPSKGTHDNKENVENNFTTNAITNTEQRRRKKRRSSISRRVSFSHLVDVRVFDKSDALGSPVGDHRTGASPAKQTTVILAENKQQLKAGHDAQIEIPVPVSQPKFGGYTSPAKDKSSSSPQTFDSPKWGSPQDFMSGNIDDMINDVKQSGKKHSTRSGKPVPQSPLLASPSLPRPTASVPTLNSLLGEVSPYKPQVNLQCMEDIGATTRDRKKRISLGKKARDSVGDASMDMSMTQDYGGILDAENNVLDESQETTTASNILASFTANNENDENNNKYNTSVDNFVVDYDSDISITIPRLSKVPGFNRLYDEEDMSMTNMNMNPNMSADDSHLSNNSELDMSMTRTFKIPLAPTNRADVTNHFISDMSMVNQTRNISMDSSADMSFTRADLGKLVGGEDNDSMDMSVTNMRIPIPEEEENSQLDMSATRRHEYNTTVNNFVVNYDDDVSLTMHLGAKPAPVDTEVDESMEEQTSKYKTGVDNHIINYDDDVTFGGKPNISMDRDEMSMTMTRTDFSKILEEEASMEMTKNDFGKLEEPEASMTITRADFGKILDKANTSMNMSMNRSINKMDTMNTSANMSMNQSINRSMNKMDTMNTSSSKLMTQDLLTSSPLPTNKVMAKLITPSKTPSQNNTSNLSFRSLPPNSSFSQSLPILPSHQNTKVSPSESFSNISMDEMLHESVRKDMGAGDEEQFSFARFLQLANIPSFNPCRASIIGTIPKISDEEPTAGDILESAFITSYDKNSTQTAAEHFRTVAAVKKEASERNEKLLASSLAPPKLYAQLRNSDPEEVAKAQRQAKKLRNACKTQAKLELLEGRRQMDDRATAVKRHDLALLSQDASKLVAIIKSMQALSDELPSDLKQLEQTKRQQLAQQLQLIPQPTQQVKKYTISSSSQTERVQSSKSSKRVRSEHTAELQRKMNEDFDLLKFMQPAQYWIPRVFTEKELLVHWDFYKVHVVFNPANSEVLSASFGLINPSQRLNDFHVGLMRDAGVSKLLQPLTHARDVPRVLQQVFHRLHRVRLVLNTVKRLSATYHAKTDIKFIRHTPTKPECGVIEIQFSDHRANTKFGVVFELTCGYPFSDLVAFPRKPLFGNVTTAGIAAVLETIEPGYERLERACAALQELAVEGKDPVVVAN